MKSPLQNFFSLASGEIISRAIGFIATIYLARTVGVEGLGILGFVWAVFSYLSVTSNPGLDTIGIRETATGILPRETLVRSVFQLRLFLSIFSAGLLLLLAGLLPLDDITRNTLLLQGLNLLLICISLDYFFQGKERMHIAAAGRILKSGLYFFAVIVGIKVLGDLPFVPVFHFGAGLVASLLLLLVFTRTQRFSILPLEREYLKYLLRAAIPLGVSALLIQIYHNIDIVMLGLIRTKAEVGLYTGAYRIILLLSAIPSLILQAYFPRLARNPDDTGNLRQFFFIMSAAGLPITLLGFLLAEPVLTLLFGPEFIPATTIFRILLVNVSFVFFNIALANPLVAWKKDKQYMRIVAAGAGSNLILNLIFIPMYGMTGAAVTTLVAEVMVLILARSEISRLLPHGTLRVLLLPFAPFAAGAGIVFVLELFTSLPDIVLAAVAGILYFSGVLFVWRRWFAQQAT